MKFKFLNKFTVLRLTVLLLGFAFVLGACDTEGRKYTGEWGPSGQEIVKNYLSGADALNWGTSSQANVSTLGLTPGNDTTEIYLNWYSSGAQAGKVTQVRFIRGTLTEGRELIEETGTISAAGAYTAHKAAVKGIRPGSSYQYAVSSDGNNWSTAYDFKVPSSNGAFRFAMVADAQVTIGAIDPDSRYPAAGVTTAQGWIETMQKIVDYGDVSFIASVGDQVDAPTGIEAEYTIFFDPPGLRSLPYTPVAGNHDRHLLYNYHFNWPNPQEWQNETDIEKGRNYYYLYNNILFVVLNTAPTPASASAAQLYIQRYDFTLNAAKTSHAGKYDWLIVQHHKSTASVADHCADRDLQYYVEAGFEKLMSEHKVDFVFAGHDHVYARSYPLSGRDGGKVSVPDKTKGGGNISSPGDPIYVTLTTAGGGKYYAVSSDTAFNYQNTLYVKNNAQYPYLGDVTNANGDSSTFFGSLAYMNNKLLPVSNAVYVQPYIPSYTIVDVNGKTITFKTFAIATLSGRSTGASADYSFNAGEPYDSFTVTK